MFFRIAVKNVKRSFRDYSIYFLTLTFAVCIFYSFNSIEAQGSILEMGKSTASLMSTMNKLIAGTSVFVSFILGILITFANNFLIKRRKKELGIYMTLGMSKGKISKILITETLLIGILSLAVGLFIGILISQGLSVVTAKLLAVDVNQYRFIISISAIIKSVLYFGIIYLLVMILNQIIITKYRLIDMLNAAKKNQEVRLKNMPISIATFLLSVVALGSAYLLILRLGILSDSIFVLVSIVFGLIGTILFFFSLSNFFIHIVQKSKKVYLKELNIFILRQIHNKINTNFLSMSIICLMLFLTITLLFTMFGYKDINDRMLEGNTSFGASAWLSVDKEEQPMKEIEEYLKRIDFQFDSKEEHSFYHEYDLELTLESLLSDYLSEQERMDFRSNYMDGPISAIKQSDYNAIRQLKKQEAIELQDNEVLVVSNYRRMNKALDNFMKNEDEITIGDEAYLLKNEIPIEENIMTTAFALDFFYLIIPDSFGGALTLESTGFSVIFDDTMAKQSEQRFSELFDRFAENRYIDDSYVLVLGNTIEQVHARIYGSTATIVFLGIYLGVVFLISSAAVLALQQLSDASDSIERYKALRKIGATNHMINRAILTQNTIYFMVPLALAIIHSFVGINVVNELFRAYNQSIFGRSLFMIALVLTVIYGGYFYATYLGFKNIVKNSN